MRPNAEQEAAWQKHKEACYQRWREMALTKCLRFLQASTSDFDHAERWRIIKRKMGPKGEKFAQELARRFNEQKPANQRR